MKDYLELKDTSNLIVTVDNAGSIGEKKDDQVKVSCELLSYYTVRNAVMENMSQNTTLKALVFTNFCGDENHHKLVSGINKVLEELEINIPYISSTETNFTMNQSAFSVTVIGEKLDKERPRYNNYAVVGYPLIGNELIDNPHQVITLKEFKQLVNNSNISKVVCIGSKGIYEKGKRIFDKSFTSDTIDLYKSAGPSTSVLIEYDNFNSLPKSLLNKITILN
ncbi:ATP-binding protein [Mycoplasmatota bacterium]|nr:ATP-binding protein [Mycoplasmatota bacterium]